MSIQREVILSLEYRDHGNCKKSIQMSQFSHLFNNKCMSWHVSISHTSSVRSYFFSLGKPKTVFGADLLINS